MTKLTRCKNLSLTGKTNLQNNMHQSKNLLIDWQYLLITSTIFKNKIPSKTLTPLELTSSWTLPIKNSELYIWVTKVNTNK